MNPRFVTNEEALLRGSRNTGVHGILSTLGRLLTNLDNFDHPGCVPDHPCFEGVRFLTTLDRFLAPPNFRGGQEPVHPGQVPDTPEKLNFTKILKT